MPLGRLRCAVLTPPNRPVWRDLRKPKNRRRAATEKRGAKSGMTPSRDCTCAPTRPAWRSGPRVHAVPQPKWCRARWCKPNFAARDLVTTVTEAVTRARRIRDVEFGRFKITLKRAGSPSLAKRMRKPEIERGKRRASAATYPNGRGERSKDIDFVLIG